MSIRVKPLKKRLCAASFPHPEADQGWYFCELESGHGEDHRDRDLTWHNGMVVEVTTVEEVMAVPNHIHAFVDDEDTCTAMTDCPVTWAMHLRLQDAWRKRQVSAIWQEYQGVKRPC